ncbi:MAG TPA: hypothetical protein VMH49_02480 [Thermoplasmata archaeon]|nr:hypothetical protein [Thermoplasmata archaeon]
MRGVAWSAAGSGVVLGLVAVLLAQQLGALPLSEPLPTALWLGVGMGLGGIVLGEIGALVDAR